MIAAKIESSNSTVRIHDEFFDNMPEYRMKHLNRIVPDHYKRRYVSEQQDNNIQMTANKQVMAFE